MKRVSCIILSMIMIMAFISGCSNSNQVAEKTNEIIETATKSTGIAKLEPITITAFNQTSLGDKDDEFKSPVAQKIKEATGVTLDIEYAVGDYTQKVAVMIASEDFPDIMTSGEKLPQMIQTGSFMKLDKLIDEYGPNIKKLYGDYYTRLKYSTVDPSIYVFGIKGVNEITYEPNNGFELQHAVVKELGYPKLKTLKDLEDAIRTYMQKYPEINGQPTLGMSLLSDDWRFMISVSNPGFLSTGGPDDGEFYYNVDTGKSVLHLTRPEEKEYYRWLNHMYNTGLLDKESFVQKYDQYLSKIASGRVLALADAKWEYIDAQKTLISQGMEERTYGQYPLVIDEKFKYAEFQPSGWNGLDGGAYGITKACKNPERVVQFVDWMCTDEAQVLLNWGIEGLHYNVVDGKRVVPEETWKKRNSDPNFIKETGIELYTNGWPLQGKGVKDATGNLYNPSSPESILSSYTKTEKEVLDAYGVKYWKDLYPSETEFKNRPYAYLWNINPLPGSETNAIKQKYTEIVRSKIPVAIMSKPDKFDSIYDKMLEELEKANISKLEEELDGIVQDRLKLWE